MKTYKMQVTKTIEQDDVDNILDSAFTSCGYWVGEMSISKDPAETFPGMAMSEMLTRGAEFTFKIDESFIEGGATEFVLTLDNFLEALGKHGNDDWEDFDGGMADAVLQDALFGEVVYG